jgi:hydrogenase maturation protein HypF
MIQSQTNSPVSTSCGRLFDAAAALAGMAWERQDYEGQAAMLFEAALDPEALGEPDDLAYPFSIPLTGGKGLPYVEPLAAWRALLGDLVLKTPVGVISARFHRGLAKAIVAMARPLTDDSDLEAVALTGGCFQNATLFRLVHEGLEAGGLTVVCHTKFPANDGGIALGQAAVALAAMQKGRKPCVSESRARSSKSATPDES